MTLYAFVCSLMPHTHSHMGKRKFRHYSKIEQSNQFCVCVGFSKKFKRNPLDLIAVRVLKDQDDDMSEYIFKWQKPQIEIRCVSELILFGIWGLLKQKRGTTCAIIAFEWQQRLMRGKIPSTIYVIDTFKLV